MLLAGSGAVAGNQAALTTMHQAPVTPWGNNEELAEEYARDPKAFLMERCDLWTPHCTFMGSLVCCATYYLPAFDILPNGTKFYRTDTSHNEALWQGKVGLVVGKGPLAFRDEPALGVYFHDQNVEIGDWVQWDIHDARQATLNRIHCRYVKDTAIIGKWDDPRFVY
jgi:hypothetical protein